MRNHPYSSHRNATGIEGHDERLDRRREVRHQTDKVTLRIGHELRRPSVKDHARRTCLAGIGSVEMQHPRSGRSAPSKDLASIVLLFDADASGMGATKGQRGFSELLKDMRVCLLQSPQ